MRVHTNTYRHTRTRRPNQRVWSVGLTCLNTDSVPAVQHLVSDIQAQMRSTTSPMAKTCITKIYQINAWQADANQS